ncbi:MAG: acetate--CoA ligase family protein [Synergistaceae bacterium]|jgi:acetyltransferase|nr:acetate--CoA ligase family protein [Synergistaceae bacterium]
MPETGHNVEKILSPKSIALIGVSGDAGRATYTGATGVLSNLIKFGYKGRLYPVNPKYDSVMEHKSYASLDALPEAPDLLVIGVASTQVLAILEQAAKKGVGGCVVISSGFGENEDAESRQLQKRMVRLSQESGIRILGPNCLGIANIYDDTIAISINALSAGPILPGSVALVSQSGALASTWMIRARDRGFGYSYVISSGNNADLDLPDFIHYLVNDPHTKVIAAYLEGIGNPEKFREAARLCQEKGKPLVVYKVGRSEKGAQAAQAHTGSIAGSGVVVDALFEKCHVVSVDSIDRFLDIPQALSLTKAYAVGTRMGVMSISGGAGGIISDVMEELRMEIPDFAPETVSTLGKLLPSFATLRNPLDTTAAVMRAPADLIRIAEALAADPNIDAIYVSLTVTDHAFETTVAEEFVKFYQVCKKPLAVGWFSGSLNREGMVKLQNGGVPCFDAPKNSLFYFRVLAQLARWQKSPARTSEPALPTPDLLAGRSGALNEYESRQILKAYGIASVREANVQSLEEGEAFAEKIGYPVVLKINSEDIPHKSDAGCVVVDVRDVTQLRLGYNAIMKNALAYRRDAKLQGVLVQEMVQRARECIVGVKSDPHFGPVVMFGLGGVFVELLRDVRFRMAPLDREEALEMVEGIRAYKMLTGYRGQPGADIEALVDALVKVSRMACSLRGRLRELDINPLMVLEPGRGVRVADALIVLN